MVTVVFRATPHLYQTEGKTPDYVWMAFVSDLNVSGIVLIDHWANQSMKHESLPAATYCTGKADIEAT